MMRRSMRKGARDQDSHSFGGTSRGRRWPNATHDFYDLSFRCVKARTSSERTLRNGSWERNILTMYAARRTFSSPKIPYTCYGIRCYCRATKDITDVH